MSNTVYWKKANALLYLFWLTTLLEQGGLSLQWHRHIFNRLDIPSLTLWSMGWDKSTINLHLSVCLLGITPNLLICTCGIAHIENGPATQPIDTSDCT